MSRRLVFALDLIDDAALIAAYEARHAPGAVWPEVIRDIVDSGFETMEIWRIADRMVMIADVANDYPRDSDPALQEPVMRWESEMDQYQRPILADGLKWAEMKRIFDLREQRS